MRKLIPVTPIQFANCKVEDRLQLRADYLKGQRDRQKKVKRGRLSDLDIAICSIDYFSPIKAKEERLQVLEAAISLYKGIDYNTGINIGRNLLFIKAKN